MLKPNIELIHDGERQALLTWHKADGQGGHIPIAFEFAETLEPEARQKIAEIAGRPIREASTGALVYPGSSKHFLELPRPLARLGFRTRTF